MSGNLAPARDIGLTRLAGDLARIEATVEAWSDGPREAMRSYRRAIDALRPVCQSRDVAFLLNDRADLVRVRFTHREARASHLRTRRVGSRQSLIEGQRKRLRLGRARLRHCG